MTDRPDRGDDRRSAYFATTRWSLVCAAADESSPQHERALEELCRTYWFPLYAYIRRTGRSPEDAQDLTQAFFVRLLERNTFARARAERGRFRGFLLATLKNFLADEADRTAALKRGGGVEFVPLDPAAAEDQYAADPADGLSPDAVFERRWVLTLLDHALDRLRAEYAERGRAAVFDGLKDFVWGTAAEASYAEACAQVGLTENAARVAVHRLRTRFGEILRGEIAHTVADPVEVDAELRHLMAVLSA